MARPHLEYSVSVPNPYLCKDIKLIEEVKCRATKLVQGTGVMITGLTSIINGSYDIDRELFFQFDDGVRRGHNKKLFKKKV